MWSLCGVYVEYLESMWSTWSLCGVHVDSMWSTWSPHGVYKYRWGSVKCCHFGLDDHTQWPQPFSAKFPHLSCILTKIDEHSVIWDGPTRQDFIHINYNQEKIGFGKWSECWLETLGTSTNWLLDEVARRRVQNKRLDLHTEVMPLSTYLRHALWWLHAVSMSQRGAMISL